LYVIVTIKDIFGRFYVVKCSMCDIHTLTQMVVVTVSVTRRF